MKEEYYSIINYIDVCYKNDSFDDKMFEFYKTRKEKGKYRAGIINWNKKKYFFKIIDKDDYNDEQYIKEKLNPALDLVPIYYGHCFGEYIINLYKYIDAPAINAFNYLRSNNNFCEKKDKINNFFARITEIMNNTSFVDVLDSGKKSDRWFFGRIGENKRSYTYYENNFEKLLNDINEIVPNLHIDYIKFFDNLEVYLKQTNYTVLAYNHGDFHDFNFSLDGLFWDIDTFDYNPVLNDFVIYYWHYYAREDGLIYKYSPWLVNYMNNQLNKTELNDIRKLKEDVIIRWFKNIKTLFVENNLEKNFYNEFIFKLFCRMFLIDNVLNYSVEDRIKIYKFFYHFLANKNIDIENLLFSSEILFV